MRHQSDTWRMERINMPRIAEYQSTKASGPPAPSRLVGVTFSLDRPEAREVCLCGDFNQWSPTSLRMIRHGTSGHWEKRLTLAPGCYQYKFVVNGEWVHDPKATENVLNNYGSINSVRDVHE